MTKLIPIDDRIVVEPVEEADVTASGIIIPDTGKEKSQKGKVIAVGPGKFDPHSGKRIEMPVKKDDIVLFKKYGPDEVKIDNKDFYILEVSDVLAIVA